MTRSYSSTVPSNLTLEQKREVAKKMTDPLRGLRGPAEDVACLEERNRALEAALREAMEWNWIEDASLDGGIPESVVKQCNDALGASELETSAQRARVPTTNHANLNEACQEILRVLATEKETLPASISVPATTKVDAIGKQSTLCAVCDQIKELHPATHKWTAKETKGESG